MIEYIENHPVLTGSIVAILVGSAPAILAIIKLVDMAKQIAANTKVKENLIVFFSAFVFLFPLLGGWRWFDFPFSIMFMLLSFLPLIAFFMRHTDKVIGTGDIFLILVVPIIFVFLLISVGLVKEHKDIQEKFDEMSRAHEQLKKEVLRQPISKLENYPTTAKHLIDMEIIQPTDPDQRPTSR